jgi:hypothetical protein
MVLLGFFTFAGMIIGQDTWGDVGVFIGGFLGFMSPILVGIAFIGWDVLTQKFDRWKESR